MLLAPCPVPSCLHQKREAHPSRFYRRIQNLLSIFWFLKLKTTITSKAHLHLTTQKGACRPSFDAAHAALFFHKIRGKHVMRFVKKCYDQHGLGLSSFDGLNLLHYIFPSLFVLIFYLLQCSQSFKWAAIWLLDPSLAAILRLCSLPELVQIQKGLSEQFESCTSALGVCAPQSKSNSQWIF